MEDSYVSGRNPVTWTITAAPQDLHEQEAQVRDWNLDWTWELRCEKWMFQLLGQLFRAYMFEENKLITWQILIGQFQYACNLLGMGVRTVK